MRIQQRQLPGYCAGPAATFGLVQPAEKPVSSLTITSAEWQASKSRLIVQGTGNVGQMVCLYNAGNMGDHYGAALVSGNGRWKLSVRNPSPVPGRLLVMGDGQSATIAVANTPSMAAA